MRSQFLDANPKVVEHIQQVFLQIRLPLLLLNPADELLRRPGTERIDLQQAVPALFEESANGPARDRGPLQKVRQLLFGCGALRHREFQGQVMDGAAKLEQQFVAAFEVAFKGIQTLVIPARQDLLRAVREKWDMDLDVFGLSDAIQPSDALLEQLRIERKVKQDQVMRVLEVAAFTADLRTDQQPRSVGLGEPRGVAIPLQQRQSFMENSGVDGQVTSQRRIERLGLFNAVADQQYLLRSQLLQQFRQPKNPRVFRQIQRALQPCVADILSKLGGGTIQPVLRFEAGRQSGEVHGALRKAAYN